MKDDPLKEKIVCRLCLKNNGKLLDIFKKSADFVIADRIMECTNIQATPSDGFPPLICASCLRKLNKAHKFIKNCERSQEILKSLKVETTVKEEFCDPSLGDQNDEKWSLSDDECIRSYYSDHKPDKEEDILICKVDKKEDGATGRSEFQPLVIIEAIKQENFEDFLDSGVTLNVIDSDASFKDEVEMDEGMDDAAEEVNGDGVVKLKKLKVMKGRRRTKAKPTKCLECGRLYKSAEFLLRHLRLRHGEQIYEEYVKTHNVQDRPFECSDCGKTFPQRSSLKSHLRTHTKERPHKCDICNKTYKELSNLTVHKRTHSDVRAYPCDECPKAFHYSHHLQLHKKSHSGLREHVCSYCARDFVKEEHLVNHIRTHTGEKLFSCELCGKAFGTSSSLRSHKITHVDPKLRIIKKRIRPNRFKAQPEKCSVCNKLYRSAEYLLQHMKKRHDGEAYHEYLSTHKLKERPYICSECGKGFTQPCNLLVHQRGHTQERPFECEICHKRFVQISNLRVHMRGHTDLRAYKCDECGKAFRAPHHLKFHLKIHSNIRDHICSQCGKGFRKEDHLSLHMRTHTGEKPYTCEICGKFFSSSSILSMHRYTHNGQKPFICKYCNRAFSQKSSMYRHLHTHRNDPEGRIRRRNKIINSDGEDSENK